MLKQEFERLAMKNDATIPGYLFDSINRLYMADNNYHVENGGVDESKTDFVKRVFGGKVNTVKTIALKLSKEKIRENDYCVGKFHREDSENHRMAEMIIESTCAEATNLNCGSDFYQLCDFVNKNLLSVTYVKGGKKHEFVYIRNWREMK